MIYHVFVTSSINNILNTNMLHINFANMLVNKNYVDCFKIKSVQIENLIFKLTQNGGKKTIFAVK